MDSDDLYNYWSKLLDKHNLPKGVTSDKSGFFDLPQNKVCQHPEHNPPSHMVIPYGKGYRHVCPSCGNVSVVSSNSVMC